jgi:hypothetical protein
MQYLEEDGITFINIFPVAVAKKSPPPQPRDASGYPMVFFGSDD